jgi:hypothetical protein
MAKYFPIKTATACQLKWNWSTLVLYSGETGSCHRSGLGKITPDTFDTFHNTEKKQTDRNRMLAGEWPNDNGCYYCRDIEHAGGSSDRIRHLDIIDQSPPELDLGPVYSDYLGQGAGFETSQGRTDAQRAFNEQQLDARFGFPTQ